MLWLDSVFPYLLGPVLLPLACQQCAICGLLLGWNSARMLELAVHKAWTLWMMLNVLSFVPLAINTAPMSKATVMQLSEAPSLPALVPVPYHQLMFQA